MAKTKWEYFFWNKFSDGVSNEANFLDEMNRLGNEGWELISTNFGNHAIFKREK